MNYPPKHSRRAFLGAAMAGAIAHGCGFVANQNVSGPHSNRPKVNQQRESTIALIACHSYKEDLFELIKPWAKQLIATGALPDLTGKTVLIKPNMVEYRPNHPVTTNPAVLKAAAHLVDYLGAKEIVVGEGPGHMRDTEFLLDKTGLGAMCKQLGLRFIDLNLDEIEPVENKNGLTEAEYYYLPKSVLTADAVVSLPKLKAHHWVGMTASMKNLLGTIPGRKYGWPKNLIHWLGIQEATVDLNWLIRPSFALVDAITAMEGDGPINGTAIEHKLLALGNDLAALDATCARTMAVDPMKLKYLEYASHYIGNVAEQRIKVVGASVAEMQQQFVLPSTFTHLKNSLLASKKQDS